MTRDEVEKAIQDADKKMQEYREQLRRQGNNPATDPNYQHLKSILDDVRKHHVTGAAGSVCTCCNGSGRQ
jgi:hypothetical protein